MKDRVHGDGKGTVAITYDWKRFVEDPQKQGYYAEAFSSADAMLDDLIYRLFQLTYQTNDNFNLINFLRPRLKRKDMLKLMRDKGVVDDSTVSLYGEFNWSRNKVLHSPYVEYNLVIEKKLSYKGNEEFYALAMKEADNYLSKARTLFFNLVRLLEKLGGKVLGLAG